jgi:hypothetical protein
VSDRLPLTFNLVRAVIRKSGFFTGSDRDVPG